MSVETGAAMEGVGEKQGGTGPTPPQNLTVSEVFGQTTWLMTQSRGHRNMFISDLEWMVMPPILLRQFRLFPGKEQPLGIAFWAQLSDEASQRLEQGGKLKPDDWKSGDNLWLVELLAPFGQQDAMLADLRRSIFKNKQFRMHATDPSGQRRMVTMNGDGFDDGGKDGGIGSTADAAADPTAGATSDGSTSGGSTSGGASKTVN
ncbi:toxin-activating lysine-acyltransferase [Pyruvatibacter mobilis]|uniref:toxin-activating lysine-acyltransferase n=1 Tax=Pyruvatibacter mobilis TaxID=1712261 RepID=UPI003BAE2D48